MNQNNFSTFQNSAFPQIKRAGTATKKKSSRKPNVNQEIGRGAKIDADVFYHVKEENEQLKKTKLALNQKIIKLEASIANVKENIIRERRQADYKVVNIRGTTESDWEKTRIENQKLKSENEKKDLIIQGLQSNALLYKAGQKKKTKKPLGKKDPLTSQTVKNDYLALISRLREQLKIANEDRRNLINEMKTIKDSYQNLNNMSVSYNSNTNNINYHNKELSNKYADLNTNYEKAILELDHKNRILEMTKKSLEEERKKYEKERENNIKLQTDYSLIRVDSDKIAHYKKQLEDSKKNQTELEEELSQLRVSPFIKKAEEMGNVYRKLQTSEKKLMETEKALREKESALNEAEFRLRELEIENKELSENLKVEKMKKEEYKEDALKQKIANHCREKNDKLFQEKLSQFNQYGEIDSNFVKILSLYKNENDNINWGNINFIQPDNIDDPNVLKNENNRLKIEKDTLGKELQYTKDLLLIQQQVNEDNKKLQDFEAQKYKSEIKILKEKIEELCNLLDIQKMEKPYSTSPMLKDVKDSTKIFPRTMPVPESNKIKSLDDNITEFSQEETEVELAYNENALDIYFGECLFEEALSEELGYNIEDMSSFFSVDFYIHETQTSDILTGKNPMFNFQVIFKVEVNEYFLDYLENDGIFIEFYSIRDNVKMIFGKGRISLKELMELENSPEAKTRVINSEVEIYHNKNMGLKVATLYYKMRMRKPLSEVLKWYHEQNQLYEEKDQMQEALKSKAEETLNEYTNLGGKAYEVKILINKAKNLIIDGPARRISPYFYYNFYKNGERYSKVCSGNNPQFEDTASFNEIYNKELIDYLEKESLKVYIFDSMNPMEVDMASEDEVRLSNSKQQISQDLIGVCSIPLQGLLINDLIQGEFPIYSLKEQKVGTLVVNIIWEEIQIGVNEGMINNMMYKTEIINQDNLILKLANTLKEKGLNLESAFNIFDIDGKNEISLDNFKNTLIFTLRFTTNQNEMEHLIKILFTTQGRSKLDKADFYNIFAKLLPGGQLNKTQYNINIPKNINNNINNSNTYNIIDNNASRLTKEENEKKTINDNNYKSTNQEIKLAQSNENNNNIINNNIIINNKEKSGIINSISNNSNNSNRTINEIGDLILKYKKKIGKSEAVNLFIHVFDKDASLGIDKKEMSEGFQKMGIILTEAEKNDIWKKMGGSKGTIDFASFKKFHDNYCKGPVENTDKIESA